MTTSKAKTVEIKAEAHNAHYAEEGQDQPIKFAYVARKGTRIFQKLHSWIVCRDFLGDALYSEQVKKAYCIWSFSWDGKPHLDRKACLLALKFPKDKDRENFFQNLDALRSIEKENGMSKTTKVFDTEDKNLVLVSGPTEWQSSIFLVSLYTFLLKVLTYSFKDSANWMEEMIAHYADRKDAMYLIANPKMRVVLPKVLKNLGRFGFDQASKKLLVTGYPEDNKDTSTVHNYTGFVSTIGFATASSKYGSAGGSNYVAVVKELAAG